jgi:hypothetical protein
VENEKTKSRCNKNPKKNQIRLISLENMKNIISFTRFFENRYVQITSIRKRMELAKH